MKHFDKKRYSMTAKNSYFEKMDEFYGRRTKTPNCMINSGVYGEDSEDDVDNGGFNHALSQLINEVKQNQRTQSTSRHARDIK